MISREQIKDATLRRLKYEIKVCTEHNNPKAEDYQEQIDNIDLYVDEKIAKLANLIIERVHYFPIDSMVPTGRVTPDGRPTYFQPAGEPLGITAEEFGTFGKNHAPKFEQEFIDMINEFYGIKMPYRHTYREAMINAHTNPTPENLAYFANLQRNNGEFITLEGLTLLPTSKDALYYSNEQNKTR